MDYIIYLFIILFISLIKYFQIIKKKYIFINETYLTFFIFLLLLLYSNIKYFYTVNETKKKNIFKILFKLNFSNFLIFLIIFFTLPNILNTYIIPKIGDMYGLLTYNIIIYSIILFFIYFIKLTKSKEDNKDILKNLDIFLNEKFKTNLNNNNLRKLPSNLNEKSEYNLLI